MCTTVVLMVLIVHKRNHVGKLRTTPQALRRNHCELRFITKTCNHRCSYKQPDFAMEDVSNRLYESCVSLKSSLFAYCLCTAS